MQEVDTKDFIWEGAKLALTPGTAGFPDGLVTCSPIKPDAKVIDSSLVVFDAIGGDPERTDRIEKLREYLAVVAIQRHVGERRVTSFLAMIDAR